MKKLLLIVSIFFVINCQNPVKPDSDKPLGERARALWSTHYDGQWAGIGGHSYYKFSENGSYIYKERSGLNHSGKYHTYQDHVVLDDDTLRYVRGVNTLYFYKGSSNVDSCGHAWVDGEWWSNK